MSFDAPAFLLLGLGVLPILLVARRSRAPLPAGQLRVVTALQVLALLAAAVAMARPFRAQDGPLHHVVVWGGASDAAARTRLHALREANAWSDPFLVVRAGSAPKVGLPGHDDLPDASGTPDLAAALAAAAAAVPHGARADIALFTDGRHDGPPLTRTVDELAARGLPVQVHTLPAADAAPAPRLLAVRHPVRVAPGEPFRLHATVHADAPGPARLDVRLGARSLATAAVQLAPGEHVHTIDVAVPGSGAVAFEVHLATDGDADPRRGVERTAVLVDAPLRVLHLAADASRAAALAAAVQPFGIATVAADPARPLDRATFADVAAVFVDDLPASAWPAASQEALGQAVREDGTGLVLAGTHHNLGPGGYAPSPLAAVLPVRMPQREERRDPSVSLVLIVDTSGSMGGGRLELAKEVARLALQKLQPHDKCGLIEFHGSKRWAAPLQPATNTIEITRALNRLQVGGGTIIYDALEESYYALLSAQTRFQHVLVLTDGGVESGPFEALARRMAAGGQTVSTVLIGPQANSPFLQNLAQWGRGRFYACPDKFQLPDLQFREPQSALLPAVQERRVPLERAPDAEATAAFAGDHLPASGGLVEASVRPGAEVLLRGSAGEPWLIGWDHGAGRILVLAGQALGPQSGELREDPAHAAFLADLLRSAGSGATARTPRLELSPQERGVRVRLHVPPDAQLPAAPVAAFAGGPAATLVPIGAHWDGFLPWTGDAPARLDVRSAEAVLASGACVPPGSRALRTPDVATELDLLRALPAAAPKPQATALTGPFALAALLLFLLGLLLRRAPFDAGARRAPRLGGAGLILAMLGLAGAAGAQQPWPANDEGAIRAAIDEQLRQTGDLTALAAQWREAPALHRYWLARLQGDLATAAALCADPALATTHRDVRVQMLDMLGRPQEALAAMAEPDASAPPVDRGHALLRRAWLHLAAGDRDRTAADLQAAVAQAAHPAFTQQAGVLAAAFGFFDLALQWHTVGPTPGRDTLQAALRRGLWQQRAGRPAAAAAEYELAFARATLQRDRTFALAMVVAAARSAGTLGALADRWLLRARGDGPVLHPTEVRALCEVLRELGRARDGLQVLAHLDREQRGDLGDLPLALAVEAGEPDAAIAQLRGQLAADPQDFTARCSLALLLADLQRDAEAAAALQEGLPGARPRALRALCAAASELGFDSVVAAIAAAFAGSGDDSAEVEAALLEVAHARRQGRDADAIARLLRCRDAATKPADQLRLAEQFESLGRTPEAIALHTAIWDAARTEDTGMRLAWLLGESKVDADRARAAAIYRELWTRAGSASRRVQAEDHVLDLAAREGTLADLAISLETQLADPATPNRPAVRDALVKIYTRARDTTGAAAILEQWQRDEPQHRVEALQQLARVHVAAEEFRSHERVLQRLIEIDPEGELDYRQQLAMSALERGRPQDARQHIRGLLDRPGTPDTVALEFAAGIYALAAMHEESVRLYRRALALHPERVETWLLLGNALRAAGQRQAAIGTFQELLLRPLPDDLFVVAVDGLLNMEAPPAAVAAAARLVRLRLAARPETVFLHRLLQDLLEAQQDEAGRLAALEDTVMVAGEQRTNFVRELMQEAAVKRDWRTFAAHGRTLLLLGDEVPPAVYLTLGEALLQLGDLDGAARSFARARLGTDFAATEVRTAELYEDAGRLADAERIRVRLLRRTPDDPAAILAVARLGERQGAHARALPHWLAAARKLLPAELATARPAGGSGRRLPVAAAGREKPGPAFAEPFAGALRCATNVADLLPLQQDLLAATQRGPTESRLAALPPLRQLALAFPDDGLAEVVRAAEDALLATGNAHVRDEVRAARVAAGNLAEASALATAGEVTAERLRLLLLAGDAQALAAAAAAAKPALLPDLARALVLAGRSAEAEALLPLVAMPTDEAGRAARADVRASLGLPAEADPAARQAALAQALARTGPLLPRIQQVLTALRALPELPAGERQGHVRSLALAALDAKDVNAAERLLSQADADLDDETRPRLVELLFTDVPRASSIQLRARYLGAVPTERALELVRAALKKVSDAERRTQLLWIVGNGSAPEPVLLALVADLDLRGLQDTDRSIFTTNLDRSRAAPAVLQAVAARFASTLPDDPLTLWLQVRTAGDAAAQRTAALQVLPQLATRNTPGRTDTLASRIVRAITPADAKELAGRLPARSSLALRTALLQHAGDKLGAAEALMAAFEQKPDETPLLYQAATLFESEGQHERAAALYRRARQQGTTFYPYQAQQLARLELLAGRPEAALDALRAAKDPSTTNFRLWLRVLAEVPDAKERRAALAQLLQQRSTRAGSGLVSLLGRSLDLGGAARGDRLATVLAPPRLPALAPHDLADADEAPSDLDLLAFLPEGEEVARTLLRTLDDKARSADLGIYRGMLGAAARAGRGTALVDAAAATLRRSPYDAEAGRVLLAAAQIGLPVPAPLLAQVLQTLTSDGKLPAATAMTLVSLAEAAQQPEWVDRVLRLLLTQRSTLADAQLRTFLPGLFAFACARRPEQTLALLQSGELDGDAEADLASALLCHHADPAAAARAVLAADRGPATGALGIVARQGDDLLPRFGAHVVAGDLASAFASLQAAGTYWMPARSLPPARLGAAVPPLARWSHPELAGELATGLLAQLGQGDEERRGAMARLAAVLAARLAAAGQTAAAADLRTRLQQATIGLPWTPAHWLE